ncbi:4-aminobutyrate aminotransferase [Rhizorhabdus wittichii RW1]|jgi:4-aminobutyrate aminotransferase/(S)-3-amino-2-methylpropionate transaminase|uniref:4-aminobutyrate aminotransferase n=2 Tax=Rhizorhabdus wittichii TaxID=160791 RepID=A0A9J9LGK4_RHIWR|nr:4-aminobutyrate--2-oxoglutarate transaminase [Rhizorhabdus wittichii]ABQ70551.1 4-aminobutyrate aminotransferase [Rhizorhabdus wittichii RW1]QTH23925.1 4-aminobutyrate--2-oxoglutarate transaminase [Rhizorhabdus wittichii]
MTSNADLLARRRQAVARGVATAFPIFAARADNAEIWDVDGQHYVDFAGGIAVLNTGHRHPKVIAAVQEQLALYTHMAFQVAAYEPYVALAERLNALAPFTGEAKTILFTTGAEATENAVKLARAATGRSAVIAFGGGFHGRTLLAMAMTGKVAPYKQQFGPMPGEIFHVPFPVAAHGGSVEETLRAIEMVFRVAVEPGRVAALIIEPILGEGGFYEAPVELLRALRALCDRHGIILIADEVQTGFGRTGRMFAIEHSGVEPDLVTVAKSLAGGFPLSGVIGRSAIMEASEPGGMGGTYGGNPVACAAALAVLDVIAEEQLLDRAVAIGARIKERLRLLARRNDLVPITEIRGPGAMIGFDIVTSRTGYEPDPETTRRVVEAAREAGLILLSCGIHGNVIRILVPLTVPDDILDAGLAKLEQALAA